MDDGIGQFFVALAWMWVRIVYAGRRIFLLKHRDDRIPGRSRVAGVRPGAIHDLERLVDTELNLGQVLSLSHLQNTIHIQIQYKYNTIQIQYNTNTIQYKYNTIQIQYNTNTIQYKYNFATRHSVNTIDDSQENTCLNKQQCANN